MVRVKAFHTLKYGPVRQLFNRKGRIFAHTYRLGVKIQNAAKVRLGRSPKRIDTGRLRASITVTTFTWTGGIPGVRVGTNVEYAIYVHEGTRYMQANPFIDDAVRQVVG